MNITMNEVNDFYRELALLTESRMPLPESLRQLAENARRADFRTVLRQLGEDTARGISLPEAMARHPACFPPYHVRMIAMGEKDGVLPEILHDDARVSLFQSQLTAMVKDILTYPLLTTTVACFILFGLMYWVMPQFAAIFEELLEGAPLPWLTQVILSISRFTREHWPVIAVLFAALIGFTAWLLSDGLVARRLFIEVVKSFPFSGVVFYNLAMARICSLWAIMIRRQVSHQEALLAIAPLVEHRSLGDALERLAAKCAEGHSLVEEMARETDLSEMLLLTFRHSPEKDLANRLAMLGELFRQRASMGFRRVGIVWEFTAMMAMAGIVGLFIFIAFMPFLNMLF